MAFVRIDHDGIGMESPIVIVGPGNWDLAQALAHTNGGPGPTSLEGSAPAQGPNSVDASVMRGQPMDTLAGVGRAGLPNAIELGGAVLGVVMCGALLWFGVTVAIPQFGLFGLFWTAFLVAIIVVNLRRIWFRRSNSGSGRRASQDSDRKGGGS